MLSKSANDRPTVKRNRAGARGPRGWKDKEGHWWSTFLATRGFGFERGTQQMRLHYGQMFAACLAQVNIHTHLDSHPPTHTHAEVHPHQHIHQQTNRSRRVVCAFMAAKLWPHFTNKNITTMPALKSACGQRTTTFVLLLLLPHGPILHRRPQKGCN